MVPSNIVATTDVNGTTLTVTGGQEQGYAIAGAKAGRLNRLVVKQLTGTADGFTATLYNNPAACPTVASPGVTSPSATALANGVYEELYRITAPLVVTSTNTAGIAHNLDSHFTTAGGSTDRLPVVYIKINAAGTGAKTFAVAMTVVAPYVA